MNPAISWIVLLGSSVAPKKVDVRRWRLFVLARERKCEAFTSRQRTSSPGKLQRYQFNKNWSAQKRWQGDLMFLGKVPCWLLFANLI